MANIGDVLFGSESKVETLPTQNVKQRELNPLLLSAIFGGEIDPSLLASNSNIRQLVRSGALDDLIESFATGFQGDRVADLTETQRNLLGTVPSLQDKVMAGPQQSTAAADILSRRGINLGSTPSPITSDPSIIAPGVSTTQPAGENVSFGDTPNPILDLLGQKRDDKAQTMQDKLTRQVVGEDGPEVITASQDLNVVPQTFEGSVIDNSQNSPLAVEQNQQNVDPNVLLGLTGLQGLVEGGPVRRGDSVVVGEDGPEVLTNSRGQEKMFKGGTQLTAGTGQSAPINPLVAEDTSVRTNIAAGGDPTENRTSSEITAAATLPAGDVNATPAPGAVATGGGTAGDVPAAAADAVTQADTDVIKKSASDITTNPANPVLNAPTVNPLSSPLQGETNAALSRSLSGNPSTTINKETTDRFIQESIADPARRNFDLNTLQQIKSSFAGSGFSSSARAMAESRGRGDVESQINSLGAQARMSDEQQRRQLAENAADRALQAVPASITAQNNPLAQMQAAANIASTQADTSTEISTLKGTLAQQMANVGLTNAQVVETQGKIIQDVAETGKISQETRNLLQDRGLTTAAIDKMEASTAGIDLSSVQAAQNLRKGEQEILTQQINNLSSLINVAGIEQGQDQNELNAQIQEWIEANPTLPSVISGLSGFVNTDTQTGVAVQGTGGIAGSLISAGGQAGAAAILASDRRLKKNIEYVNSPFDFFPKLAGKGAIWEWNDKALELGLTGKSFGLIAQDVQDIMPEAVVEKDGYLAINYNLLLEGVL